MSRENEKVSTFSQLLLFSQLSTFSHYDYEETVPVCNWNSLLLPLYFVLSLLDTSERKNIKSLAYQILIFGSGSGGNGLFQAYWD